MMQLDKTRVAIRQRSALEIFDVALRLWVAEFGRLFVALVLGATPIAILNYYLLSPLVEFQFMDEALWIDDGLTMFRYIWLLFLLTCLEAPLGTIVVTAYLGQAMFLERPTWRQLVRDCLTASLQLIISIVILRGLGLAWLMCSDVDPFEDVSLGEGMLFLLAIGVTLVRVLRPFITEIILLERTPLFTRSGVKAMTTSRRSSQIHGAGSENLSRGFVFVYVAVVLFGMVFGSVMFVSGISLNDWGIGPVILNVFLPLAMWMVAGFLAVARFLNYLDVRIRQEGWEVDLLLRAEAARWSEHVT